MGVARFARWTPVIVRIIVGLMMTAHGWQKLDRGPASFGQFLKQEGLPLPVALGWAVTLLELVGGGMLVAGLLARLVALLMTLELIGAIIVVTGANGLIGRMGVGYERDLAYIAGFVTVVLLGPGRPSIDHLLGIERGEPRVIESPETRGALSQG